MKALISLILISLSFFAFSTFAVEAFRGPQSAALGGSGLAGLDGAEGTLINPAQVALMKGYTIDLHYHDGDAGVGQSRNGWAIGAGDNGPDVWFPGAAHYARIHDTGRSPQPANGELIQGAIGEMVLPGLAFGIGAYQLTYHMPSYPKYTQLSASLGTVWMFTKSAGVAYALNNIFKPSSDEPVGLREPLQQGLGFYAVVAEIASVRFDITRNEADNPDKKLVYKMGFESMSGQFLVVRAGFRDDEQAGQHFLTAGLGFNGPRLKVDYAFEKNTRGTSGAVHSVDLRLPF